MFQDLAPFTALALATGGILLTVSCLFSQVGNRLGVPLTLLFLVIGMLAGSDGVGGIWFESFDDAYVFGTLALVVILFSGGINTPLGQVRGAIAPATVLATAGVVGVAGMTALGARLLGLDWGYALLVGAIVSSTDAAAVFAVLDGIPLRKRVGLTVEIESGLNDPVAVILTLAMAENILGGKATLGWALIPQVAAQLLIGGVLGIALGIFGRLLIARVRLSTPALSPVLSLGLALIAYGVPTWLGGSGFLAVYVAGIAIGNGPIPNRLNFKRVHDSVAWLAQISMFLLLGLLVFPSQLPAVASTGLLLALYVAFIARPLVVSLCLLPFGFEWREIAYISWVGLRGAVPIILATIPVLNLPADSDAGVAMRGLFHLVFFVVVVGSIVPGTTVRWLSRVLGIQEPPSPAPSVSVDITASRPIRESQLNLFVGPDSPAAGKTLGDLQLPPDAVVMLIVRDDELIAPRGTTRLEVGDHAFVMCQRQSTGIVRQTFERTGTL